MVIFSSYVSLPEGTCFYRVNHQGCQGFPMVQPPFSGWPSDAIRPGRGLHAGHHATSGGSSQGSGINYQHDKQKTMRIGCEKIIHI